MIYNILLKNSNHGNLYFLLLKKKQKKNLYPKNNNGN